MTERVIVRLVLAFAFCMVFAGAPIFAQQDNDQLMWRDENGNLHFRDEDGNYMIDAQGDRAISQRSDSQQMERQSGQVERQSDVSPTESAAVRESGQELPATAGELPLLGLIGALSLAGAGAVKAFFTVRR